MSCLRGLCGKTRRSVATANSASAYSAPSAALAPAPRNHAALTYTRSSFASSVDAHSHTSSAPLLDNPLSRRGFFNYALKTASFSGVAKDTNCHDYVRLGAPGRAAGAANEGGAAASPLSRGLLQAV